MVVIPNAVAGTVIEIGPGAMLCKLVNDPDGWYKVRYYHREGRPVLVSITNLSYREGETA